MYETPRGVRVLPPKHAELFKIAVSQVFDDIRGPELGFSAFHSRVKWFDKLPAAVKISQLLRVTKALLQPEEPAPPLNANVEATVGAIYLHLQDLVICEMTAESEITGRGLRDPVVAAYLELQAEDDDPDEDFDPLTRDKTEWGIVIESLTDAILYDRDFMLARLPPKDLRQELGIEDGYFGEILAMPNTLQHRRNCSELQSLLGCYYIPEAN